MTYCNSPAGLNNEPLSVEALDDAVLKFKLREKYSSASEVIPQDYMPCCPRCGQQVRVDQDTGRVTMCDYVLDCLKAAAENVGPPSPEEYKSISYLGFAIYSAPCLRAADSF